MHKLTGFAPLYIDLSCLLRINIVKAFCCAGKHRPTHFYFFLAFQSILPNISKALKIHVIILLFSY